METQDIGRLQEKVQAFHEDDEKVVVARVLLRAAGEEDVVGHIGCMTGCAPPGPDFSLPAGAQLSIATSPGDSTSDVVIPL